MLWLIGYKYVKEEREKGYLCRCPESKCKWKPIGEGEDPSVNSPSNKDERKEKWKNHGLLLLHLQ